MDRRHDVKAVGLVRRQLVDARLYDIRDRLQGQLAAGSNIDRHAGKAPPTACTKRAAPCDGAESIHASNRSARDAGSRRSITQALVSGPLTGAGGDAVVSEPDETVGSVGGGDTGETLFGFAAFFFGAGFGAAFGAGFAFAFAGAADLRALFVLTAFFAAVLTGRPFFLTTRFFAAGPLAFFAGRFLDLLFFAMVTCLLAFDPTTR